MDAGAQECDYMFSGRNPELEWQRLDKQHKGITRYLRGALSFAALGDPKRILEMGAGTGEWAAQAAHEYPEATIVAADKQPLPPRPFPKNVEFQQVDLLSGCPWENESFDVIHIRLLLYHMPRAKQFLHRAVHLLKPGGWLLVEDCCLMSFATTAGPALHARNSIMGDYMLSNDLDPFIGANIQKSLDDTGSFSVISVHQVSLPFMPLPQDPALRDFAFSMKESIIEASSSLSTELVKAGITDELREAWLKEMNDPRYDPVHKFFFVWACKSQN